MSDKAQKIREIHADNTIIDFRIVDSSAFVKLEGDIEPVDLEIQFLNCLSFWTSYGWQRDLGVDTVLIKTESELLTKNKQAIKVDHPDPCKEMDKYKSFQFIDDDGNVLVELIAEDYKIS